MDGVDRLVEWGQKPRAFRRRNGLKQEAAASLLGVSQAYVSRMENGEAGPSPTVRRRLQLLSALPEHRSIIEMVKSGIRHSPALTSLVRRDGSRIIVEEHSRAFYGAGHPFDLHKRGGPIQWDIVEREAVQGVLQLSEMGAFRGKIGYCEVVWSSTPHPERAQRHFRTILTPVKGEDGEWRMQVTLAEIDARAKEAARQAWGGLIRYFDYDEEPPYDWP
ncbi:MAG: helix-turn-helix domain-containing protein [Alphaproteobacteria bacterium]|nr:helix-turn-helix domain-containing protein [Alphaproteobacteria bacterium]